VRDNIVFSFVLPPRNETTRNLYGRENIIPLRLPLSPHSIPTPSQQHTLLLRLQTRDTGTMECFTRNSLLPSFQPTPNSYSHSESRSSYSTTEFLCIDSLPTYSRSYAAGTKDNPTKIHYYSKAYILNHLNCFHPTWLWLSWLWSFGKSPDSQQVLVIRNNRA